MIATLRQFTSFGRPAQVLFINQAGINVGLFMLMPYLADHLTHGAGLAVWMVGLILGVRNLSQGLFIIGGTLADRVGYKPMIMAGCILLTVAFGLFAVSGAVPWLLIASALTGIASALFMPAARAYLAHEESERIIEAFAVFGVFHRAGMLIGPLAGMLLLRVDFSLVCLTAAGIFAGLTVAQWRFLPACAGAEADSDRPVWSDWLEALGNRTFLGFAAATFTSYALAFQVDLGLPLEVRRVTGAQSGVVAVFAIFSLLGMAGQVRLTTWQKNRWTPGQAMVRGLVVMGISFAPLIVALPAHTGPLLRLAPILVCATILTVGTMMVFPFEMATIANLAGGRSTGTYYSLNNLLTGVGILGSNLLSGAALDLAHNTKLASLPWLLLLSTGLLSALGLKIVDRGDRLSPARLPTHRATATP